MAEKQKFPKSHISRGIRLLRVFEGNLRATLGLAHSPSGELLVSGCFDGTVRLWETSNGNERCTLNGHQSSVPAVSFNSTGELLATASHDGLLNLWRVSDGKLIRTLHRSSALIWSVVFDPNSVLVASAGHDNTIRIWNVADGRLVHSLVGHEGDIYSLVFDTKGEILASAGQDGSLRIWSSKTGALLHAAKLHTTSILAVAFDPKSNVLVSGSQDGTISLWNIQTKKLLRSLDGYCDSVLSVSFSYDRRFLAALSSDEQVYIWRCDNWTLVSVIPLPIAYPWIPRITFHPKKLVLAVPGSQPNSERSARGLQVHYWELDPEILLSPPLDEQGLHAPVHYVNAKVVLVGDTGVGKSGLALVLTEQPFEPTDSTPGRNVWMFESQVVLLSDGQQQTRETLLWDFAGQPGYRIVHQLHLNEVAVAVVVFDARSETDPFSGVRHWAKALRVAHQRQGTNAIPLKKLLVSARIDRGGVAVTKEELSSFMREFQFDAYLETSAKEARGIEHLRKTISEAIEWEHLPIVTSSTLFVSIKDFAAERKKRGLLLTPLKQLTDDFILQHAAFSTSEENLAAKFQQCISRLENRDIVRRLSFGEYILLRPELLDAYASALVIAAKEQPDGLGSILEDVALDGQFFIPTAQKQTDSAQTQLLLHATVEELVRHDLALRENAEDGRYLVFPSQFNREYEDTPEPKGKVLAVTFDGPVQSLYATLVVRLGHSGLFTGTRTEMWRNAAIFSAKAGGRCGIYLREFAEARGRIILFFERETSDETRFHFEEFVFAHLKRRAVATSVEITRFYACPICKNPVPDAYVKMLREQGETTFRCFCKDRGLVSLLAPEESLRFSSKIAAMDKSADQHRDFETFVVSANAETRTQSFKEWAGGERVTLAIVFTDVVSSTALGEELRDMRMNEVRRAHFEQSRKLITRFKGREIKTIGDSFMAAFRSVDLAVEYSRALQANTGHVNIRIRAGIHIGPMQVEEGDVFGGTVNFAARVVGAIPGAEIWLSDSAKRDLESSYPSDNWIPHPEIVAKGFRGTFLLWSQSEVPKTKNKEHGDEEDN